MGGFLLFLLIMAVMAFLIWAGYLLGRDTEHDRVRVRPGGRRDCSR